MNLSLQLEHLDRFNEGANTGTPYIVCLDSGMDGPHVVFSGGIHGNETGGVEAELRLIDAIRNQRLNLIRGQLSFVLGNPHAYRVGQRYLQKNLNTLFGRSNVSDNTIEDARAIEIVDYIDQIKSRLVALIDFHSVSERDMSILIYNISTTCREQLAHVSPFFDYHFAYDNGHLKGILSEIGIMVGATGLSVECGSHTSRFAADRALHCMKTVMQHHGIEFEGDFPDIEPEAIKANPDMIKLKCISPIIACSGFHFENPDIKTGSKIRAGEIYARGDNDKLYIAEKDCSVFLPDHQVTIGEPDAGFLCGELSDL